MTARFGKEENEFMDEVEQLLTQSHEYKGKKSTDGIRPDDLKPVLFQHISKAVIRESVIIMGFVMQRPEHRRCDIYHPPGPKDSMDFG